MTGKVKVKVNSLWQFTICLTAILKLTCHMGSHRVTLPQHRHSGLYPHANMLLDLAIQEGSKAELT